MQATGNADTTTHRRLRTDVGRRTPRRQVPAARHLAAARRPADEPRRCQRAEDDWRFSLEQPGRVASQVRPDVIDPEQEVDIAVP